MAGLYIHVPFCKSRCIYCDFFSSTRLEKRQAYLDAVCREMELRQPLQHESWEVSTVYIGGGTPSQLTIEQLGQLMSKVHHTFRRAPNHETTIELNPSDVTPQLAYSLRTMEINRVSLGIQTLDDGLLRLIGRRHDSATAIKAVKTLQQAGFDNISIDLIYGLPGQNLEQWLGDIDRALKLGVQHLSAYSLMYEEGTRLMQMRKNHEIRECDDELSRTMYTTLMERMTEAGFEHYEISNFALPGRQSRHNSSYWDGTPYLGLGAGAHSYDGTTRSWNPTDLSLYIDTIGQNRLPEETEHLTTDDQFNETVMTRLRTSHGLDANAVMQKFGVKYHDHLAKCAAPFVALKLLKHDTEHDTYRLTAEGIFTSNDIISSLFV